MITIGEWGMNGRILSGLKSYEDADKIRRDLAAIAYEYELVRLADVYDIAGALGSSYTDNNIGWSSKTFLIEKSLIAFTEERGWHIIFPDLDWGVETRRISYRDYTSARKKTSKNLQASSTVPETYPISITINTETIDTDRFSLGDILDLAHGIKDRAVYISVI
jgi:hypothetical protein